METKNANDRMTGAEHIEWDLSDLYSSTQDDRFQRDISTIEQQCATFHSKWKGAVADLDDTGILDLIQEYEVLVETVARLSSYAQLVWSTDTENPANGRTLQMVRETTARASQNLVFVDLEIGGLPKERIESLLDSATLKSYHHWIKWVVENKQYALSEEVERVLAIKSLTSRFAWVRMHDELMNVQVFKLNGREYTESQILKLMQERDRETRKAASIAISEGLTQGVRNQAFIFNTVIADHAANDALRGFSTWISSRNMANEATDASVDALVSSVVKSYSLAQRFYRLKKRILGYDQFHDYDRNAPVGKDDTFWTWEAARDIVIAAYTEFHPRMGEIATMFFEKNWIHAPVRKGKNGGAYSAGTIPSAHPYVFLNYTGTNRDVQVLAHELGHGIHQYLSRQQGPLLMDTPLTVAETASVFGEIITFNKLFAAAQTDEQRLSMLVSKLDDILATVHRQISFNRFEDMIHTARRTEGELSVDRFSELWLRSQQDQFGDTVILSDGFRHWWSYISHFMHVPGYVYAYAFGELLVLSLYEEYKNDREHFPDKYLEMLSSGGSKSPVDLLKPFGLDIEDPAFWDSGLGVIQRAIVEAERLADVVASAN